MQENTKEEFVSLHNHSHYSLLDGFASVEDLVDEAVKLGYKSLALTDHGTCGGLFRFQKECIKRGIKPILGMEAYTTDCMQLKEKESKTYHLLILAKNTVGYKNLIKLSSLGFIDGFYKKPRIDFELLKKHKDGLIVTSACQEGEIPQYLLQGLDEKAESTALKYKELFGDDFYIEVMTHKYFEPKLDFEKQERSLAVKLYKLAKKLNIKAICTNDAHYARKTDSFSQDVLLSIQTKSHIKNPKRFSFNSDDFYLKSIEEMKEKYKKTPELLANTVEISNKIEVGEKGLIVPDNDLLPDYKIPDGFDGPDSYLKHIVKNGMKGKGLIDIPEYRKRIKYEMSVITKCGYVKYFLILWDIINFCRQVGIRVGIGRGSAVSSLVLYVCGITKLDPIKYDLIFERFLNPERISPPDVDVDFDYDRREEVFQYIIDKYGKDQCTQIGTYGSLKAKAVVRFVVKAMDLGNDWEGFIKDKKHNPNLREPQTKKSLDLSDRIARLIPIGPNVTIEETMKENSEFRDLVLRYPRLSECLLKTEGVLSSSGVHASGTLVCKTPVIDQIPLRVNKGVVCSQYDGPEVEELGLLKFDILGLKTLTVVDESVKNIKERHGVDIDVDLLEPNDPNVFSIFSGTNKTMDTRGIFQFESDGMQRLLGSIRVDAFDDLIVANALYRPGTLKAGVHDLFCDYKHGRKQLNYSHPKMGEALKDTYGIMVYQENIMKVAQVLAGFSGGQADILRKVVGKKKPELIKKEKLDELFINGCVSNGIKSDIAKKIFDQICFFAGYGFNKSHSAAYAFLAYQTAFLKVNYPIEYMCSLLTSEINNNDKNLKLDSYIDQAGRMGIICMPPNINKSGLRFKIEKGFHKKRNEEIEFIRKPLTCLNGVGAKAVEDIVNKQPFTGLEDFVMRIDHRVCNSGVFKTLVDNGCMSTWKMSNEKILEMYPVVKEQCEKERRLRKKQDEKMKEFEGSLFDDLGFDFSASNVNV